MLLFSAYLSMFRYFVVIWRLSPPIPPWPTHDGGGGDFDPLDKILLGGGLMGGGD